MSEQKSALERISQAINGQFTPDQLAVIKSSVAKDTTNTELAYFVSVCHSVGLNPLNKEVWCYKDHKGNLIMFTSRDGLLRKAQETPAFNGLRSAEVCEKDHFLMDIANNKIEHRFGVSDRGPVVGAYAIVFRKDGEPTIEWVPFKDYAPSNASAYSPWKKYPASMIKKVAESHALKKAFALANGVNVEYDFEVEQGVAKPKGNREKVNKELERLKEAIDTAQNAKELLLIPDEKLDKYEGLRDQYEAKMEEFLTLDIESDEV